MKKLIVLSLFLLSAPSFAATYTYKCKAKDVVIDLIIDGDEFTVTLASSDYEVSEKFAYRLSASRNTIEGMTRITTDKKPRMYAFAPILYLEDGLLSGKERGKIEALGKDKKTIETTYRCKLEH